MQTPLTIETTTLLHQFNKIASKVQRVQLILLLLEPMRALMKDERSIKAVECAEAYTLGLTSDNDMYRASTAAWAVCAEAKTVVERDIALAAVVAVSAIFKEAFGVSKFPATENQKEIIRLYCSKILPQPENNNGQI